MPPIRVRIRTLMIAIAAVAVLMGLFRFMAPMLNPIDVITALVALVVVLRVLADVIATRRQRRSRKGPRPFPRSEPAQSGVPNRV